ncbi:hypothetical protein D3C79_1088640 [compost metagenome]
MDHLGVRHMPVWVVLERLSPLEKMEVLCHGFDVQFPLSYGPSFHNSTLVIR